MKYPAIRRRNRPGGLAGVLKLALLLVPLVLGAAARGNEIDIDLEWRPLEQTAAVGETVGVGLYAVSAGESPHYFSAAQVIINWDAAYLELLGTDETGGVGLYSSGFPADDAFGLNEASPPADGDGLWVGLAFPDVLPATPDGSLLTTLIFEAVAPTPGTAVAMVPSGGDPLGYTKIIGDEPGLDVLGTIGPPASIQIVPEPATAMAFILGVLMLLRRHEE